MDITIFTNPYARATYDTRSIDHEPPMKIYVYIKMFDLPQDNNPGSLSEDEIPYSVEIQLWYELANYDST